MSRAYVDESQSNAETDPGVYLFAAALIPDAAAETARTRFEAMRRPDGRKLHWYDAPAQVRREVVKAVIDLDIVHVVVVRVSAACESSERRRRKCLERLAYELAGHSVKTIIAESRERKADSREFAVFQKMSDSGRIARGMRLEHVVGATEPLLWIPDVVAGAHVANRTGTAEYWDPLAECVHVVEVDDRPRTWRES